MEISIIDLILIISVLINFILLKKISNKDRTNYLVQHINNLKNSLEKNEEESKKFMNNIHFHHKSLSNSIIYHLHASGTTNIDKLWETYHAEVKDEWSKDEKWPEYLPIDGNPEQRYSKINIEEYNQWLSMTKNDSYLKHPSKIINHNYILEMKHDFCI